MCLKLVYSLILYHNSYYIATCVTRFKLQNMVLPQILYYSYHKMICTGILNLSTSSTPLSTHIFIYHQPSQRIFRCACENQHNNHCHFSGKHNSLEYFIVSPQHSLRIYMFIFYYSFSWLSFSPLFLEMKWQICICTQDTNFFLYQPKTKYNLYAGADG